MTDKQFRQALIVQLNTLNNILAMDAIIRNDNEKLAESLGEVMKELDGCMKEILGKEDYNETQA